MYHVIIKREFYWRGEKEQEKSSVNKVMLFLRKRILKRNFIYYAKSNCDTSFK